MLILINLAIALTTLQPLDFKTPYVDINLIFLHNLRIIYLHFKTPYVDINRCLMPSLKLGHINFKTPYVDINRILES